MRLDIDALACIVTEKTHYTADMRMFCFPYAGGGASIFRNWSGEFGPAVEVCAVQPPGRETRFSDPLIDDVHELVRRLLPSMALLFDRPFVFFGYSTGALVAFELIRELRKQQMPLPDHLVVAAARAPHIPEPSPLHHLPEEEFLRELQRFSGTPEEILQDRDLMNVYVPIIRADLALEETYAFQEEPPINVPVTAFYGVRDDETPKAVMEPWGTHTTSPFELISMPGDHFFIRTATRPLMASMKCVLNLF